MKAVVRGGVWVVGFACLGGCQEDPSTKIAELRDLARHPGPARTTRIEKAFADEDRDVRATSVTLMAELDAERGRALALRALDDRDGTVRAAAVRVLARQLDAALTERLASLGPADPVWQVRSAALEALSGADGDPVRAAFEQGMADGNPEVRRAALRAGRTRPGLLSTAAAARVLANDDDWQNRVVAAEVLGASADPEAYAALDEASADPHEFVRAAARRERVALSRAGTPRPSPPPPSPSPDTTKRAPGV